MSLTATNSLINTYSYTIHIHISQFIQKLTHTCTYTHTVILIHTHTHIYTLTNHKSLTLIHTHTHTQPLINIYSHSCIYTYILTYAHIHTRTTPPHHKNPHHTHLYTCTHTTTFAFRSASAGNVLSIASIYCSDCPQDLAQL